MTMNTSGFYKNEDGQLLYGPTTVQLPISCHHHGLNRAQHDSYTYPVEGWYWFDTENEARAFFDMPLVEGEPAP